MGEFEGGVHLIGGEGNGWLEYDFDLPEEPPSESIESVRVVLEASSKRPGAPQTDADTWPSILRVSLNGIEMARRVLRNQPADSRGALSHMHGFQGRYGELLRVQLGGEDLARALEGAATVTLRLECEAPAGRGGGLVVYGSRAGRYPCEVQLLLSVAPPT